MEEEIRKEYIKRCQKDYSMCFKLGVVQEVERGQLSVKGTQHKYGIQGNATVIN